jgi:HEAT repeat protein
MPSVSPLVSALLLGSCLGCLSARSPGGQEVVLGASVGNEPPQVQVLLEKGAASMVLTERARAIEALVHSSSVAGAGEWGPRGIWDPDPWVQLRTVRQLGARLPEAESLQLIRTVAERASMAPTIRCAAVEMIGISGASEWLPSIREYYQGDSAGSARIACARVGHILGDPQALEALATGLIEDDLPTDPLVIRGLSDLPAGHLESELAQALEWAEEGFDLDLAGVLAERGIESGWARLQEALASEDELRGLESLDILTRIVDPRSTSLLRAHRTDDSLAGLGSAMLLETRSGRHGTLRESAGSKDRELRALAVEVAADALRHGASGRLARESRSVLSAALTDEALVVRLAALYELRTVANDAQLETLFRMLGSAQSDERLEVALTIRYRMAAQSPKGPWTLGDGDGEKP